MAEELKARLRADLTTALKARDQVVASTIRMALTAITNAEVAGKQARTLTDGEVVAVLVKEAKQRAEAAQAYAAAGRTEAAEREQAEGEVLRRYLPQPLTEAELEVLIGEAVAAAQAAGLVRGRAMGAVMGALRPATAGRVDGAELAAAVQRRLGR
jgi:uncharacterized protein YqeY